jgi:hypothetical protein
MNHDGENTKNQNMMINSGRIECIKRTNTIEQQWRSHLREDNQ